MAEDPNDFVSLVLTFRRGKSKRRVRKEVDAYLFSDDAGLLEVRLDIPCEGHVRVIEFRGTVFGLYGEDHTLRSSEFGAKADG